MKKTLTALVIAGAFVCGGAAPAFASYAVPAPTCSVSPASVVAGATAVVTCEYDEAFEGETVRFSVSGAGIRQGDLAMIAFADTANTATVDRVVTNGTASTQFVTSTAGVHTVDMTYGTDGGETLDVPVEVTVTSSAAGSSASGSGSLPVTGGSVPTEAVWIGVGALALGGIAVAAAVARRRAYPRD